MRPASPYRRHSAIALVFAAWCAAYGVPAELVRTLAAQSTGASQLAAVKPAKPANLALLQIRRGDPVHIASFVALPELALEARLLPCSPFRAVMRRAAQPSRRAIETLFERPPPSLSFPA